MKLTGFNKVNKHKRFNYTPRYYNPDKEEREARNQRIKEELGIAEENEKKDTQFKPDFKEKYSGTHLRKYQQQKRTPLYKTVITIITVLLLAAVIYLTFYLSTIMLKNA